VFGDHENLPVLPPFAFIPLTQLALSHKMGSLRSRAYQYSPSMGTIAHPAQTDAYPIAQLTEISNSILTAPTCYDVEVEHMHAVHLASLNGVTFGCRDPCQSLDQAGHWAVPVSYQLQDAYDGDDWQYGEVARLGDQMRKQLQVIGELADKRWQQLATPETSTSFEADVLKSLIIKSIDSLRTFQKGVRNQASLGTLVDKWEKICDTCEAAESRINVLSMIGSMLQYGTGTQDAMTNTGICRKLAWQEQWDRIRKEDIQMLARQHYVTSAMYRARFAELGAGDVETGVSEVY
jgi:hypothetical protein